MYPQSLNNQKHDTLPSGSKNGHDYPQGQRFGIFKALFHDATFDDCFMTFNPLSYPLFKLETESHLSPIIREVNMLNWVITFFLLAILAAVCGFGGLAGTFASIAKLLAIVFVTLFIISLIYSVITGRRPNPPLP